MDRDTAVARIQEKLGFRTDLVTNIQSALQDAQDELERGVTLPPWLWQEDMAFQITAAVPPSAAPQEFALPTNFIRESDEQDGNLYYTMSNSIEKIFIQKMDFREAEEYFFGRGRAWWDGNVEVISSEDAQPSPGAPIVYVLRSNTIRIYPGPDQTYNLLWTFYGHDSVLNGGNVGDGTATPNGWLSNAPWLLIGEAGKLIAQSLRDQDALTAFVEILEGSAQTNTRGARRDYLNWVYSREIAGREYRMGGRL